MILNNSTWNAQKTILISIAIALLVLLVTIPKVRSFTNTSQRRVAITCIENDGIPISLAKQIEVIEYGDIPGASPDKRFKLKAVLDEDAYSSIISSLNASNVHNRIDNTEEDYIYNFGPSNSIISSWGINLTDVTDTYYSWTAGKVVWTLVTSYIFAEENGKHVLYVNRWG